MERWEKGCYYLPEAAFAMGSRALGYKAIAVEMDNKESVENIDTAARILLQGEWLAQFLRQLFCAYRSGILDSKTPEGTFYVLNCEMEEFDNVRENAADVLRDNPDALTAELRDLAQKRPDLFKQAILERT